MADAGLGFIDVIKRTSDYELRLLPLQWAIDKVQGLSCSFHIFEDLNPDSQAIIELQTGVSPQTPREWPYSKETNEEQATDTRLSGLRELFRRIYLTEDL